MQVSQANSVRQSSSNGRVERPVVEHAGVGLAPEAGHGGGQKALGLGGHHTETTDLTGAHRRVDADSARAEAVALPLPGGAHPCPHRFSRVPRRRGVDVGGCQRGELDVQVDAVEQRA